MSAYDLYGLLSGDMIDAKNALEAALGIKFVGRDSLYDGDYFRSGHSDGEHFVLKENVDPFDGEPVESEFPEYSILLYANDTCRSGDLQDSLSMSVPTFSLLRHEYV